MATISGFKRTATKLGQIISKPAGMGTNNGPYFPSVLKGEDVPSWPHATWHTLLKFSTDHTTGAGGIWLFCCNGDLDDPTAWFDWDDIKENAEFAYMSPRPANPIYTDAVSGFQTETPAEIVIGGTCYMYYHNGDNNIYNGFNVQNTLYATSADGVNYTRLSTPSAAGYPLTFDPRYAVGGDGHTGYFKPVLNPFPFCPYTYIGKSSHGNEGASGGGQCIWGSNDGVTWEKWRFIQYSTGRIFGTIPNDGYDYRYGMSGFGNAVKEGAYWRITGSAARFGTGGAAASFASGIEMLIDEDFNIIGVPKVYLPRGTTGQVDEYSVSAGEEYIHNGIKYAIGTSKDSSDNNVVTIAKIEDTATTWDLVAPRISSKSSVFDYDFNTLTTVPSDMTFTTATPSVSTAGRELRINVTDNTYGYAFLDNPITLSNYDVIDIKIQVSRQTNRQMSVMLGLFDTFNDTSSSNRMFIFQPSQTLNDPLEMRGSIGGVATPTVVTSKYIGIEDSYTTDGEASPQARQPIGYRIDVINKKAYILLWGNTEKEEFDLTGYDLTIPMYFGIRVRNTGGDTRYFGFEYIKADSYSDAAVAVPASPVMTATAGDSQIAISCPAVSGATGYKAYVGTNGVYDVTDFGASNSGTVAGLVNGTAYDVFMRSYNTVGDSEPATTQSVAPSSGTTLSMTITGLPDATDYTVDFTNPATGELVARQTDIAFTSGSATSNTITIAAGTTLEYTIRTATHVMGDSGVTA